jgi:hypothetical protein
MRRRRRERWKSQATEYLARDETIEALFPAIRGRGQNGGFDSIVVVTNKRIALFDTGFARGNITDSIGSFPRSLRLGTPRGVHWRCPVLDVQVNWMYFPEIRAADLSLDARGKQ